MRTSTQPSLSTVLTAAQARAHGISSTQLTRLVRAGKLVRIGRGMYVKAEDDVSEHRSLAEARAQARKGVICLLSALRFHDLTTQAPFEVWLAIGHKDRAPQIDVTSVRIVRFSGMALTEGIEHHTIDGVDVPVYSVAKTVADCFKFRLKIGLDVALEALREALSESKATPDEIMHFARVCRVANVIRPYLEAST
jgi:predicted transcriptional regulator of viral defense system